jgi:cytochrome c peroxidase
VIPAHRTNVLPVPPRQGPPDDPVLVALGKKIFADARLSEPPGTSCASCHDPARAFSGRHG